MWKIAIESNQNKRLHGGHEERVNVTYLLSSSVAWYKPMYLLSRSRTLPLHLKLSVFKAQWDILWNELKVKAETLLYRSIKEGLRLLPPIELIRYCSQTYWHAMKCGSFYLPASWWEKHDGVTTEIRWRIDDELRCCNGVDCHLEELLSKHTPNTDSWRA